MKVIFAIYSYYMLNVIITNKLKKPKESLKKLKNKKNK